MELTIRPTQQILYLFERIKETDPNPELDRTSIVSRAIKMALEKDSVDWVTVSKNMIKVTKSSEKSPDHIRFRVECDAYNLISKQMIESFPLKVLQKRYFVSLLLNFYYQQLIKVENTVIASAKFADGNLDFLVFKIAFDSAPESQNKDLTLAFCREYLSQNPDIEECIRTNVNSKIKSYSDYFNFARYNPPRRRTLGTCTIRYIEKILAGFCLIFDETDSSCLDNFDCV